MRGVCSLREVIKLDEDQMETFRKSRNADTDWGGLCFRPKVVLLNRKRVHDVATAKGPI